jgi:hypothetical protein
MNGMIYCNPQGHELLVLAPECVLEGSRKEKRKKSSNTLPMQCPRGESNTRLTAVSRLAEAPRERFVEINDQ